jgi:hypothetical protein
MINIDKVNKLTATDISSTHECICRTALYPAQIIFLCSRMASCASKLVVVLTGFLTSHTTKPVEISYKILRLNNN